MRIFLSLIKKESMENIRTHKFLAIIVLFVFIGLISPLTAKLTPLLLKSLVPNNIEVNIANPEEIDSWVQFFKNISQIGMFGLVMIFSNQIAKELQKGTLINLLSKGLQRFHVIISKFAISLIMWAISYGISFCITYFYTGYFFENTLSWNRILMASILPFIFGVYLISVEILGGVIIQNVVGTLLFVAVNVVMQFLLSVKTEIVKYMPIALIGKPVNLIKGIGVDDFFVPIFTTMGLIFISIVLSVIILNKKQIS